MRKQLIGLLALFTLSVNGTVLTFDDLKEQSINHNQTIVTDGFKLQAAGSGLHVSSGGTAYCGPPCVYNETHHLFSWLGAS